MVFLLLLLVMLLIIIPTSLALVIYIYRREKRLERERPVSPLEDSIRETVSDIEQASDRLQRDREDFRKQMDLLLYPGKHR